MKTSEWMTTKIMPNYPWGVYRVLYETGSREYQNTWYPTPKDAAVASDKLNGKTEAVEMSELTAVEFLKVRRGICRTLVECKVCPLYLKCGVAKDDSDEDLMEQIKIVEEWAETHPFIPRVGEIFWSVDFESEPDYMSVLEKRFYGGVVYKIMAVNNLCYRTEAAALAHAAEDLARIQALYDDRVKGRENE